MFFRYFNFIKMIFENKKNNNIPSVPFLFFNGILLSSHFGYSFLTIEEKDIVEKNKYQEIN
jgi:hypothetical protein